MTNHEAAGRRIPPDRIVTGIDFEEASVEAAEWVMRHFAPDAEHELIHAFDRPELPGPLRAIGGDVQLRARAREGAERRLEELRDRIPGPRVRIHLREGRPAAEILRLADEVEADLIVVGEQGPTRGVTALLGSTAERVLVQSRTPVLLARKVPEGPPRRLLVAIDDSKVTPHVLAWARELAGHFEATATVLNVVDRLLLVDELVGLPDAEAFHELEVEATRTMADWLEETVRAAGMSESRAGTKVTMGDPSYEIISEAARSETDLVLIGSRGGDVAWTPLIGRIVNKVVRSAPCSVLVVTNPERGS